MTGVVANYGNGAVTFSATPINGRIMISICSALIFSAAGSVLTLAILGLGRYSILSIYKRSRRPKRKSRYLEAISAQRPYQKRLQGI